MPELSVAEQVTGVTPRLKVLPEGREHDETRIPELSVALKPHEAVAVGVFPLLGVTVSGDETLNGGQANVGKVLSILVIEKKHVDDFPALSTAVHWTPV